MSLVKFLTVIFSFSVLSLAASASSISCSPKEENARVSFNKLAHNGKLTMEILTVEQRYEFILMGMSDEITTSKGRVVMGGLHPSGEPDATQLLVLGSVDPKMEVTVGNKKYNATVGFVTETGETKVMTLACRGLKKWVSQQKSMQFDPLTSYSIGELDISAVEAFNQ